MCGTTEYLPPEIIGREEQNDKVDIWCLGILLYEMTHKKTPFEGTNIHMLQFQQRKHDIQFRPNLNPQLKTIIQKCLEFQPDRRPSAEEILAFPIFEKYRQGQKSQGGPRNEVEAPTLARTVPVQETRRSNELRTQNTPKVPEPTYTQTQSQPQGQVKQVYNYVSQSQSNNVYPTQSQPQKTVTQRVEASPQRVVVQGATFKKKPIPNTEGGEVKQGNRVIKYSITRVTGDSQQQKEYRSTSRSQTPAEQLKYPGYANSSITKTVGNNSKEARTIQPPNFYNQFANIYNQPQGNLYTNSIGVSLQQQNPFAPINLYSSPTPQTNSQPTFYKRIEPKQESSNGRTEMTQTPDSTYQQKGLKYSYSNTNTITDKNNQPNISYHVSSSRFVYEHVINDSNGRKVIKLDNIRSNPTTPGPVTYTSNSDVKRSNSLSDSNKVGLQSRVVRNK